MVVAELLAPLVGASGTASPSSSSRARTVRPSGLDEHSVLVEPGRPRVSSPHLEHIPPSSAPYPSLRFTATLDNVSMGEFFHFFIARDAPYGLWDQRLYQDGGDMALVSLSQALVADENGAGKNRGGLRGFPRPRAVAPAAYRFVASLKNTNLVKYSEFDEIVDWTSWTAGVPTVWRFPPIQGVEDVDATRRGSISGQEVEPSGCSSGS